MILQTPSKTLGKSAMMDSKSARFCVVVGSGEAIADSWLTRA